MSADHDTDRDDTDRDDGIVSSDRQERWAAYLDATVVVHLDDGSIDLTGADAVTEWPFDTAVFALTAWDPAGRTRSRVDNERANEELRGVLLSTGATVHDSSGYMATSDSAGAVPIPGGGTGVFVDDGFIVLGLSRDETLDIARAHGQEAIYLIDDAELVVIATDDPSDHRTRGRLAHRGRTGRPSGSTEKSSSS